MTKLKLTNQFTLAIERNNNNLRLIVLDVDTEWVCRKVTIKELTTFIGNNDVQLFKGRLRLNKLGANIMVNVKGEDIGLINSQALLQLVN